MEKNTLHIVEAALAMFSRYGFAKTTMSDIAAEAGVARQTVYNAFSSKEDVLRAVVRHAGDRSLEEVRTAWKTCGSLEEKLEAFLNLVPLKWYEAVQSAPDWEELMDGVHRASKEEFKALEESWVEELTRIILEHRPDTASAREVAVFYYSSSKNAKYGVEDAEDLKARLSTIQRATLAFLNSSV